MRKMHLDSITARKITRDVGRASGGIRMLALIFERADGAIPISMTLQMRVDGKIHTHIRSSFVQVSRDNKRVGYEFSVPANMIVPAHAFIAFTVPRRLRIVRVRAGVMRTSGFSSCEMTHQMCSCSSGKCANAMAAMSPRMCRDIVRELTAAMGGFGPDVRMRM